jgi:4a-hydroxytetrahydrobiopterin dehydratase
MMTREQLVAAHCRPLGASAALDAQTLAVALQVLADWSVEGNTIVRSFGFADYYETMAFVNAIAFVAHGEDHHPDLVVSYNRCTVRFSTHSVGGVTENDLVCAAKADALFDQRRGGA